MPNLKEVRIRIQSVSSTQQITKAMKMVSAAKLKRAQDGVTRLRPYAAKLKGIMENMSGAGGSIYTRIRGEEKVLLVLITSNRGLCGAFNSNIIRTANRLLAKEFAKQNREKNVKVLCIGRKASEFFSKNKNLYEGHHNDIFGNLSYESAAVLAESIMKDFREEKFDKICIVYNQFKNAAVQIITTEQFLPVIPPSSKEKKKQSIDYIFEPGQEEIVTELIPRSLKIQLYKALLDSHASEHGARMTAMNMATENAQEMLKQLRLSYNKARQAAITKEILEIVSGAEALKG